MHDATINSSTRLWRAPPRQHPAPFTHLAGTERLTCWLDERALDQLLAAIQSELPTAGVAGAGVPGPQVQRQLSTDSASSTGMSALLEAIAMDEPRRSERPRRASALASNADPDYDDDDLYDDDELIYETNAGGAGRAPAPRKAPRSRTALAARRAAHPFSANTLKKKSSDELIRQARTLVTECTSVDHLLTMLDARSIASLDICREILTRLTADQDRCVRVPACMCDAGRLQATPAELVRIAMNITARKNWPLQKQLQSIMGQLTDHHVRAVTRFSLGTEQLVHTALDVAAAIHSRHDDDASQLRAVLVVMTDDSMLRKTRAKRDDVVRLVHVLDARRKQMPTSS